jgi:hypothetical protein
MMNAKFLLGAAILFIAANVHDVHAQSGFGLSWGFGRTYWDGKWYGDGYAEAGTGGNTISIRRDNPLSGNLDVSLHLDYLWQRHTTTTLIEPFVEDPETGEPVSGGLLLTQTHFTFYREWTLGANFHYYLSHAERSRFYIGGGPSVRFGHAGKREIDEPRPGVTQKATWFGLTALVGYSTPALGDGSSAFFEPQLTFSPDPADRYQKVYPPVNLNFLMGIMW